MRRRPPFPELIPTSGECSASVHPSSAMSCFADVDSAPGRSRTLLRSVRRAADLRNRRQARTSRRSRRQVLGARPVLRARETPVRDVFAAPLLRERARTCPGSRGRLDLAGRSSRASHRLNCSTVTRTAAHVRSRLCSKPSSTVPPCSRRAEAAAPSALWLWLPALSNAPRR